jgi:biopolymer transport protein ExbB
MHKAHARLLLFLLLAGGILFVAAHGAFAQDAAAAAPAAPKERTVFQTIMASGPLGMAIWCAILAASVTMVTFVIQNILSLRNDRLAPPPLITSLKQVLDAGNYQEAWEICNANRNYLANTLKAGLERIGRGKDVFDDALAEHGLREAQVLRTRNSYLSVIGVVSPMIGLSSA